MTDVSDTQYVDLTLNGALAYAGPDEEMSLQRALAARLSSIATEQSTFRTWADRFDELFFTTTFSAWGADLWADDPSATTPGRSHISVNTPAVYVLIPAALQAYPPIENMAATEDSDEARTAANALERVRKAWKAEERWQLKRHQAAIVKALYGRTASYVYYDRAEGRVCADVIQNPRNLWMGYKGDDYEDIEWVAHVTMMDPSAVTEKFSAEFSARSLSNGSVMPWIIGLGDQMASALPHPELTFGPARIEVWDYWYRMPGKLGQLGQPTKMETWNVVVAGNAVVRGPLKYAEYDGDVPYKPLRNSFIPSTPLGRSELHDMENLIREKMMRITSGAQMIAGATAGNYWQLIGPDAPSKVRPGDKPKLNEVIAPGAGNSVQAITPFIAQFQLEQFLGRLDREMAVVSGLNDLLLGLAPVQALNSSKAINALISQYELRLAMPRLLFYSWDRATWELVVKVWSKQKDKLGKVIAAILKAGGGTLDIIDPSLSPKDEMETATRAGNLVAAKLWSQARGMDAVGVDDPEQEQNIIRGERTDATIYPDSVLLMAQVMSALQSMGLQASQGAAGQLSSGQEALRQALGAATPQGTVGSQGEGNQGQTPPVEGALPEAGGAQPPFAAAQVQPGTSAQLQSMIQGGQVKSRLLTNTNLGRR